MHKNDDEYKKVHKANETILKSYRLGTTGGGNGIGQLRRFPSPPESRKLKSCRSENLQ
jgi:hypothetical protein